MSHHKTVYQFDVRQSLRSRPLERQLLLNPWFFKLMRGIGMVGLTAIVYPRFVAPYRLTVRHHPMAFAKLPEAFAGYRILHITDTHAGTVRRSFLRDTFARAMALKPDLILMSGDLIDYSRAGLEAIATLLPLLRAPDGVLTILGNHDYHEYSSHHVGERSAHRAIHKRLVKVVQRSGVRLLRNESCSVQRGGQRLQIVGLDEMWVGHMNPALAFAGVDPVAATIVLQHNPDGYLVLKDFPWHWMLCGHSHGGQVDLPLLGPLYVPMENRQWVKGFFQFPGPDGRPRTMFVSPGVGHTAPVRLRVPPEITLFTLTGTP